MRSSRVVQPPVSGVPVPGASTLLAYIGVIEKAESSDSHAGSSVSMSMER